MSITQLLGKSRQSKQQEGFTLIELIIVIVLLGVLAIVAFPRFLDLSRDARIASLTGVATQMNSTIDLVQAKAYVSGLRAVASNPAGPSGSDQVGFVVDFGPFSSEVDFRNLCPESSAELVDARDMLDFLTLDVGGNITTRVDNQYTRIGYDIPATGQPLDQGCYILYDSFGSPDCTVDVVIDDC
ncbi:type II secretion system protein [Glaciecola sp. MH2013]|uniref:type II secretion system protein n=1 Tax=Glaciecola sp. MH2013 TaxID=2785524 RepID=UPI0018A0CBFD|nr:type II secretion system protein [Glaciecola sp. MH2013]MBF7073343.1 type II secretion system protein [Glaciecola sp. MH2013]